MCQGIYTFQHQDIKYVLRVLTATESQLEFTKNETNHASATIKATSTNPTSNGLTVKTSLTFRGKNDQID